MKILFVILLFVSAAEAISKLIGLPDERFQQIERLLKGKRLAAQPSSFDTTAGLGHLLKNIQLNDLMEDGNVTGPSVGPDVKEGSGGNPGEPDAIKEAVASIVKSLHTIIPAIKILKEARERQNHEYAAEFVAALKNNSDDDHVKALLGRHIVALHRRCVGIKLAFAKHANISGLLGSLGHDDLDFTEIMGKVLEKAERDESDVFEAFGNKAHEHGIQDHPGVQVIIAVGGLVAEAACEVKLDGLVMKIGELIHKEDPDVDFEESLEDKVIAFLYKKKNKKCSAGLVESLKPEGSVKERFMNLVFARCQEVRLVRFAVDTVMNAIQLGKQVSVLQYAAHRRAMAMSRKVSSLMHAGLVDDAHQVLGEFVLTELRRGLLVGIAVHKLQTYGPKPTGPRPSSPRPSGPISSGLKPSSPRVSPTPEPSSPHGPSSLKPSSPRVSPSPEPSSPRGPSSPEPSSPRGPSSLKPSSPRVSPSPEPSSPRGPSSPEPSSPRGPSSLKPSSPRGPSSPEPSSAMPTNSSGEVHNKRATLLEDESDLDLLGTWVKRKRYH